MLGYAVELAKLIKQGAAVPASAESAFLKHAQRIAKLYNPPPFLAMQEYVLRVQEQIQPLAKLKFDTLGGNQLSQRLDGNMATKLRELNSLLGLNRQLTSAAGKARDLDLLSGINQRLTSAIDMARERDSFGGMNRRLNSTIEATRPR